MPISVEIGKGENEFKWSYEKDDTFSTGSDLGGIDAVHLESVTGSVSVTSAT